MQEVGNLPTPKMLQHHGNFVLQHRGNQIPLLHHLNLPYLAGFSIRQILAVLEGSKPRDEVSYDMKKICPVNTPVSVLGCCCGSY